MHLPYRIAFAQSNRIPIEIESILVIQAGFDASVDLDWNRLRKFYSAHHYHQVWGDRYGPSYRAQQLRYAMRNAFRDGLDPGQYHLDAIDSRWGTINATELARLDILLTDAFFRYSIDLYRGHYEPFEVDPIWHIDVPEVNAISLLQSTLDAEDFGSALRNLAPPHAGYRWLRDALAQYRQLAKQGGWPTIKSTTTLEYGQQNRAVAVLRKRLMIEGDLQLQPVRNAQYFDQALKYAVERFQVRHGLYMDGIVGPSTRSALNVPISRRIEEIKINMERWRWLPRDLGENYIMVNNAGYELLVFENGEPAFGMSVITGKPDRPTPVTEGTLYAVVLNPYWTIPKTIALEDMLPRQQRNPGFFASRSIRVFANGRELNSRTIDWSAVDAENFPYVLRQDPGRSNPLGRMKFLFNNDFDVYLHDTPSRRLFDESTRAFSSGCIRVQEPYKLASYLLRSQPDWTEDKIRQAVRSGKNRRILLEQRIPVYLLYFTAWVGTDGAISFHKDVYDLDQTNPMFCAPVSP
jgi:murein L,D-transpeptidase YcbB/YkuD